MENIIVKIQDASVSLKNFTLHPVNIEIPEGFITGITGANGAGKTTFIQMVLGCFPKMNGTVTINGSDVIQERQKALAMTGVISEKRTFYEEENLFRTHPHDGSAARAGVCAGPAARNGSRRQPVHHQNG